MIKLIIKGLPPMLLNSRMTWVSKARAANEWYGRTLVALHKAKAPLGQPLRRALVVYVRHSGSRQPDKDNLVSSFKWIQDALVYAGVLHGDSMYDIETEYRWKPASPKDGRVSIWIIPSVKSPANSAES